MLISKFNKLIRNKFVWGAFAVIVSLSMVGFFAPQPEEARERRAAREGTLFGEDVTREEFSRARLFAQQFQPMRGGEDMESVVEDETWRRLALLRYAENLGMRVSNHEVIEAIQSDPAFSDNGTFNIDRYQFMIEQQLGIPVGWFEEYIRQEILLERMRNMLRASLWIPASDLEENAARFTDTYEVSYVKIPIDTDEVDEVDVGDEEARAVYDASPEMFLIPEKRRVLYTRVPHADFFDRDQITSRQIEIRYEADPDRYVEFDEETEQEHFLSLEEASDRIREELAQEEAEAMAAEEAMQLVDSLSLLDGDPSMQLPVVASEMGMGVSTSEWLQADGDVPENVSAGSEFLRAVFNLSATDPDQSFSFGITGTNAVYVTQLKDLEEEYVPDFAEVREDALAVARQQAQEDAFSDYVDALYARLVEHMKEGDMDFMAAAEAEGLTVTDIKPFNLYDADPRDIPFFGDLAPDLLPLETGEMTPPVSTVEGKVIAYVIEREAGSTQERLALKPDIADMMQSGLEDLHFTAWSDAILKDARD